MMIAALVLQLGTVTTDCQTIGGLTTCQSRQTGLQAPPDYMRQLEAGAGLTGSLQAQGRAIQSQIDQDFARARAQQQMRQSTSPTNTGLSQEQVTSVVGSLIKAGACADAVTVAAANSMAALANIARETCRPTP